MSEMHEHEGLPDNRRALLIKWPKEARLSRLECAWLALYVVALAVATVVLHEAAHALAAVAVGVPLTELKPGFMGVNPSITLPAWFTGVNRTVVYYAGGLAAGTVLLLVYLCYWMRKYRSHPGFFAWSMGLTTLMLAAIQFATGYLEGSFHTAYVIGAMSLLSPTNVLMYGWAVAAVFFHWSLCPWGRMRQGSR